MSKSPVPDLSVFASPPRQSLTYRDLEISEKPLGLGGQAVVYEATVTGSETLSKVALKEPKHQGTISTKAVEAFLQEATTWQTIDRREREKPRWSEYEHIVGIIDTCEAGVPWIAMEYMDGGDLEERLENNPDGIPVDEALWIGECLCRGLEIADEYGYSHLDVKPKNILFRQTPDGTWNVPKLADWGVARALADETGTMEAQTVKYSAPEQFEPSEFGDPDSLTDLYQVGAVVYAMLTGEPPYTGSHTQIMRDVVLGDGPAPPSHHRSELAEAIDVAVTKAMAKHKRDRYRGLQSFEQALRAIRTDRPLPPTVATQIEYSSIAEQSTRETPIRENKKGTSVDKIGQSATWPMLQNNSARTGVSTNMTGPTENVTESWSVKISSSKSSPAVVEGTVYFGKDDNNVYALDAKTGDEQWRFKTDSSVRSSPAVVDGTVYVGSLDGNLYALDVKTGEQRWCFKTGQGITSSPAVLDDIVYFGSKDGNVYALAAWDGTEQWRFETSGPIESSPAVFNETIYIGSMDGHIYALRDRSSLTKGAGTERWQFNIGYGVRSSPAVDRSTVYIGGDNNVYALDKKGKEQWCFETDGSVKSSPAVGRGIVYVGSKDSNVYGLNAGTGDELWRFETGDQVESSPVLVDGTVYIGSNDNNVYALDAETGEKRWCFKTNHFVKSSPAVADGTVFVGSEDGNVYAISEK